MYEAQDTFESVNDSYLSLILENTELIEIRLTIPDKESRII